MITPAGRNTFASLSIRNYRLFAVGQLFASTGAWVQRIAQDWLVLELTDSTTAVGITTALQFLPILLFGLHGGLIADRYPKRAILLCTQIVMSVLAGTLALLTLSHQIQTWHVFIVAAALGLTSAIDNPARQSFVNEIVGAANLRNAISLNASVFQTGALIGPAISGFLINAVGSGYSFLFNAIGYVVPCLALIRIDGSRLHRTGLGRGSQGNLADGLLYAIGRPSILWPTVLAGCFGLFTINLPVTLAAYAKSEFHSGASGYGALNSCVAAGSIVGALISAGRTRTRLRGLAIIAGVLSTVMILASTATSQWLLGLFLIIHGTLALLFFTSTNSSVQLSASDEIRGRVMGLYLLVFFGSGALGGPLLGAIDQRYGPSAGLLTAGIVTATALTMVSIKVGQLSLRSCNVFRNSSGKHCTIGAGKVRVSVAQGSRQD